MTDASGNVKILLPLLTPYTISDEDFDILYPVVSAEYDLVAGNGACGESVEAQAKTMLLAHYLASGEGKISLKSESISKYSYSLMSADGSSSRWYNEFLLLVDRCNSGPILSATEASSGVEHDDVAASQCLDFDQEDLSDVCYSPEDLV